MSNDYSAAAYISYVRWKYTINDRIRITNNLSTTRGLIKGAKGVVEGFI